MGRKPDETNNAKKTPLKYVSIRDESKNNRTPRPPKDEQIWKRGGGIVDIPLSTPPIKSTHMYIVIAILVSAVTSSTTLHRSLLRASSTTKLPLKLLNITVKELCGFWACCCGFSKSTIGFIQASLTCYVYASHLIGIRPMSQLAHLSVHVLDELMELPT